MKGIILAGGLGSRLYPLTKVTNKHLLPIGKLPMIVHSINKIVDSGIDDIMIITGTEHMGSMVNLLGSGKDYDCNLTYRVQDENDGIDIDTKKDWERFKKIFNSNKLNK